LDRLVGKAVLQRLQERFAQLGKVTVCLSSVDGRLITQPTWGSRFSELIGTSLRGRRAFGDAVQRSVRQGEGGDPATCHDGMILYASPIGHENRRLAMIIVGTRAPGVPPKTQVTSSAKTYDIDPDELWEYASHIAPYSGGDPDSIRRFADVMADTIATLYAQALRIEKQVADWRTVHDLTGLLTGTRDLKEMLDLTVRRIVEVMPVKACGIRLLDRETGEMVIKAVCNLSDEYLRKGPVLLKQSPIDGLAFAGNPVYIPDVPNDPRTRYPDNARREGIVSGYCVPMTYRGQTIGVIRVYTGERYKFSESDQTLLGSIASQAAAAIITTRLWEEHAKAEQVERQVKAAADIQQRMLPLRPPVHASLEFGCVYDPTLEVGGDFYDFLEFADGRLGVCIADVVGKGLPAALMMASVRSALRAHAFVVQEVDMLVETVNRHMCRDTLPSEFATLLYGVFSDDARAFSYSNGGHPPPLLVRGEKLIELSAGGLAIGIDPAECYDHDTVRLSPGDLLIMVTDGVLEAMNFDGKPYGATRLVESIRKHKSLDAQQLATQILWDVRRFAGLAEQSDDITVVAAKVR
jgi:sigma-B regulation protein RsbU (phosphoserine phosphatase)